ncbi:unnamed protein product [Amoebophrya sp. A120]|nr:unnamed protein product [Amoebophrya sp. A120]|eukprot:GSA120T00011713001.1
MVRVCCLPQPKEKKIPGLPAFLQPSIAAAARKKKRETTKKMVSIALLRRRMFQRTQRLQREEVQRQQEDEKRKQKNEKQRAYQKQRKLQKLKEAEGQDGPKKFADGAEEASQVETGENNLAGNRSGIGGGDVEAPVDDMKSSLGTELGQKVQSGAQSSRSNLLSKQQSSSSSSSSSRLFSAGNAVGLGTAAFAGQSASSSSSSSSSAVAKSVPQTSAGGSLPSNFFAKSSSVAGAFAGTSRSLFQPPERDAALQSEQESGDGAAPSNLAGFSQKDHGVLPPE